MNFEDACYILELNSSISLTHVKKQYHKLALKYHPDKNGNTEHSTIKFRQINEAYHYLKRELEEEKYEEDDEDNEKEEDEEEDHSFLYLNMMLSFIKTVVESKYVETIFLLIRTLIVTGKQMFIHVFQDIDKETALHIYHFLSKYRSTIHFSNDLITELREMVLSKYNHIEIYRLNPSIHDLMENNVYKLYTNNQFYLVPLWHNELYYDGSGCELLVICEPELPDGMRIDEDNNLYVETEISAHHDLPNMIIYNEDISITIGTKTFYIPLSKLYMKREQYYRIQKQGISKIRDDIYAVDDKADIFVKILII